MRTFTVYSKPNCPFCDQSKSLLASKGEAYEEVHLDVGAERDPNKTYISRDSLLALVPTARTMPQIFVSEGGASRHIGGWQELKNELTIR